MNNRQRVFLVVALCLCAGALPFYFLQYGHSLQIRPDLDPYEVFTVPSPPSRHGLIIKLGHKAGPKPAHSGIGGGQPPSTSGPQSDGNYFGGGAPPSPSETDFSALDPTSPNYKGPTRVDPSYYETVTGIYARPGLSPNRARLFGIVVPGLLLGGAIFLSLGWRSSPPRMRNEPAAKAEPAPKGRIESKETSRSLTLAALVLCPYFFAMDPGSVILLLRDRFPKWLTFWFIWYLLSAAVRFHARPY